jgi:L-lactate dehydrogenase complex protein LldG
MSESGQIEFISTIRKALGHASGDQQRIAELFDVPESDENRAALNRVKHRTPEERKRLFDMLVEAAEPINLNVKAVSDESSAASAIVDLVRKKDPEWGDQKSVVGWDHPLIQRLNLVEPLQKLGVPFFVTAFDDTRDKDDLSSGTREKLRQQIIDSYIGITSADFCMADAAALVMRTRPGQARSVSLVPSIHVAVIYMDQVIADLKELYALLKWDPEFNSEGLTNCMTFISGPSKTADIEATMVHGAHGPREVYVFVIDTN